MKAMLRKFSEPIYKGGPSDGDLRFYQKIGGGAVVKRFDAKLGKWRKWTFSDQGGNYVNE